MTGNNVLLDTNIISALLKGEVSVADQIDLSKQVYIPVITIGELHYGAAYSTRVAENVGNILKLSERYPILAVDAETANIYGVIKSQLRKNGTPIPENDIWIAAIAKQYELVLITRDGHFNAINNLLIDKW